MDEYRQLVKEVSEKYKTPILGGYYKKGKEDPFYLKWCEECQEINLWTYWQGRINIKADILLLGQDWASPWKNGELITYVANVLSSKDGSSKRYIEEIDKGSSPTDKMLRELMLSLGREYDPFEVDNNKLFFSNLCLGYRDHGVTGGLELTALKNDVVYTEKLISIVEPKLVICIGKDAFDAFVKKTEIVVIGKDKSYYNRLASGENYAMYKGIPIFGQAHTGSYGIKNRAKYGPEKILYTKENAKKLLLSDWSYMGKYLK